MIRHIAQTVLILGSLLFLGASNSTSYKAKNYSSLIGMDGFNQDLLAMHFKLYEGYVNNTNALLSKLQNLTAEKKDRTPEFAGLKRMLSWEFDGMILHELYFDNLGGNGEPVKDSPLYQAIVHQFGSYDEWKQEFIATGLLRGIGWVVLYQDPHTQQLTNMWINEHDKGHLAGGTPLLIMDVFEHAYITQYGLDRVKYIDAFFQNINWDVVNKRFRS